MSGKILGLSRLQNRIAELQAEVPRNTEKLKEKAVDTGYNTAIRAVPVDTGELKSSIDKNEGGLGVSADHALPIEFGTFKMPAQPFIRPAFEEMKKVVDRNIGGVVK